MITLCFLKMLESNYPLSEHNVPEEWKLQLYHYKNLKSCEEYRGGEKQQLSLTDMWKKRIRLHF